MAEDDEGEAVTDFSEYLKSAAVARPGDTIMMAFDRTLTDEELDELHQAFEDFTKTTGVHIAFVEHVTAMVVVKDGGSDGEND